MAMGFRTKENGNADFRVACSASHTACSRVSRWRWVGAFTCATALFGCGDDSSGGASPEPTLDASAETSTEHASDSSSGNAQPASTPTQPPTSEPGVLPSTNSQESSPHSVSEETEPPEPPPPAAIETRLQTPGATSPLLQAFRKGAASASGLTSLKYHISSISVCESLEAQGSGFNNPQGCLELYRGNEAAFPTDLNGDWTPLADAARASDDGFVNLVSPTSRAALTRSTALEASHVRSYNYGIITWALPVKLTASLDLGDGDFLYTHDGITTWELIGNDNFKNYFTRSASSLLEGPAQEAVVLLGNGGNWFKFQQPFEITEQDISEGRSWVLDLVFNPDGIVKGYEGGPSNANLREEDEQGTPVRAITVPMIDLVPVPHRAAEPIVRESYVANVTVANNNFDIRIELYSLESDPNQTVLGVDAKTLLSATTTEPPPEASKISYVNTNDSGTLRFGSFNESTIVDGFTRLSNVGQSHVAQVACATHADRAGAEGGAFLVLNTCPGPMIDVEFVLQSRTRLDGSVTIGGEPSPDAGAPESSESVTDAGVAMVSSSTSDDLTPLDASATSPDAPTSAAATSEQASSTDETPLDAAVTMPSGDAAP